MTPFPAFWELHLPRSTHSSYLPQLTALSRPIVFSTALQLWQYQATLNGLIITPCSSITLITSSAWLPHLQLRNFSESLINPLG